MTIEPLFWVRQHGPYVTEPTWRAMPSDAAFAQLVQKPGSWQWSIEDRWGSKPTREEAEAAANERNAERLAYHGQALQDVRAELLNRKDTRAGPASECTCNRPE